MSPSPATPHDITLAPAEPSPQRPKFPKDEAGFLTELRRRVDVFFAGGRPVQRSRLRNNDSQVQKAEILVACS
jgi:hypothetical protein